MDAFGPKPEVYDPCARVRASRGPWRCAVYTFTYVLPYPYRIRGVRVWPAAPGPAQGTSNCTPRRHADTDAEVVADAEPPNTHKQKQVSKVCANAATSDRMNRNHGMSDL